MTSGSSPASAPATTPRSPPFWEHVDRFDITLGTLRAFLGSITHRRTVDAVRRDTRRAARGARKPG